jgi:hypothetical protein
MTPPQHPHGTQTDKSFLLLFFKKEALAFCPFKKKASASFLKKRSKKLSSMLG